MCARVCSSKTKEKLRVALEEEAEGDQVLLKENPTTGNLVIGHTILNEIHAMGHFKLKF